MIMSNKNPQELVDRYLQAVRFWLPNDRQQEDLVHELGEDLRSQIEATEDELGRPVNQAEVAEILKRCGVPMVVAGNLAPRRYLIGPVIYPVYRFVMKMVLLWILVPVFLFIVGPVNLVHAKHWSEALAETLGSLWSGWFISAGIITLVFAIVERSQAHVAAVCKWDPLTLPPLRKKQERQPSLLKAACEFGFNIVGLVWLLLVPQYPFLALGPAAGILKAGPIVHTFYLPFVLVSIVALVRSAITLARPQWTWFPHLSQLTQSALMLILLNFMIEAITKTPGAWPIVMLQDAVRDSPKYLKVAAIVNMSILISVASTWLGLCIAAILQTREFLRSVRKRISAPQRSAFIGVQ